MACHSEHVAVGHVDHDRGTAVAVGATELIQPLDVACKGLLRCPLDGFVEGEGDVGAALRLDRARCGEHVAIGIDVDNLFALDTL